MVAHEVGLLIIGSRDRSGADEWICYQLVMKEPSVRTGRLALAGGIAAVVILAGGGFLLGRNTAERDVVSPPRPPSAALPALSTADKTRAAPDVLNRANLIALAAEAADALAADRTIPPDVVEADGRRFDIRLPFGCFGASREDSEAAMRWRYDSGRNALRLHVAPVSWSVDDWVPEAEASHASDPVEAIEGFWVSRPWTDSEACPQRAQTSEGEADEVSGQQNLALAQFFAVNDSRQGRRNGKAYETVLRVKPEALQAHRGFQLRIKGKLASVSGGAPILCKQPLGTEQRPICIVATVVDEIAIENGATGEALATWSNDSKGGTLGK